MQDLKLYQLILIFLIINFATLGIGGFFMGEGPSSNYYQSLNKAPWTPPGWVFGAAWTTIMVCFSIFMAYWVKADFGTSLIALFVLQVALNISWNPLFFAWHKEALALIVIVLLTLLVGYFLFGNWTKLGIKTLLVAPYFIWLCIATSLNAYILLKN
jgi:benzodiazapine receptor